MLQAFIPQPRRAEAGGFFRRPPSLAVEVEAGLTPPSPHPSPHPFIRAGQQHKKGATEKALVRYKSPPLLYFQVALAILLNVSGQLLLKRAAMVGSADVDAVSSAAKSFLSPYFIGGGASLGLSSLFWVTVLKKLPLTIVHPITGVVFILVPVASYFLWDEPLPPLRLVGILVIMVGVYLVARGAP
jgi:multidrug transporter EmrE-like cation transporter